jgi:endonuclease/exonuclease/phosphatase family metal-dependent hydrolase
MRFAFALATMLGPGLASADDALPLRVLSFNIWYGGDQVSFAKVIEAIRAADADIVGLQEPDGKTLEIARAAGYPYADVRRHILSRYPLFDPKQGETTSAESPAYSVAGVDPDAVHAWAMVAPGKVVAVANTHLTSDPYGPEVIRDGAGPEAALANEAEVRMAEAGALVAGLGPLAAGGTPVILTGDFNSPSHLDWTDAAVAAGRVPFALEWPVSRALADSGFVDTWRAAFPDPVAKPGLTWTPGRPWPILPEGETLDRIDVVYAANATVSGAGIVGEPGNPDVTVAIAPFPSDHRGVFADLAVTPKDAPALIAVEPTSLRLGESFLIRAWSPAAATWTAVVVPRGAPADKGITGIAGVEPADRTTIRLTTVGWDPGGYDAVLLSPDGSELARTRFSVVPEDGRASIAVAAATVAPGSDIGVSFSGAPGFKLDWIGLYRAGEPSVYNYLGFVYTGARPSGEVIFPASELYEELAPGAYEVRLMFDDHYQALAVAPFSVE